MVDLFLNSSTCHQSVDRNTFLLTQSPRSLSCLYVSRWILMHTILVTAFAMNVVGKNQLLAYPVWVEDDDPVRTGQIETKTAYFRS